MNPHALLFVRFFLTILVLVMVGALMGMSIIHPLDGGAQRLADALMGGMLTLLTGSCYSWFFGANASGVQSAATIAKQGEMLAAAAPVTGP